MKKILIHFLKWLKERKFEKKYSKIVFVPSIFDIPEKINRKIFIVGSAGTSKWAIFLCPCSQKNRVEVNLMRSKKPYWDLDISSKKVTLWPSVIVSEKCNCHFWLRNNKAYRC